jgi:hypothetical protein
MTDLKAMLKALVFPSVKRITLKRRLSDRYKNLALITTPEAGWKFLECGRLIGVNAA